MKKTVFINGMSCGHCSSMVEKTLLALPEINQVEVSLQEKKAVIKLSSDLENNIIKEAIESKGYEVVDFE